MLGMPRIEIEFEFDMVFCFGIRLALYAVVFFVVVFCIFVFFFFFFFFFFLNVFFYHSDLYITYCTTC